MVVIPIQLIAYGLGFFQAFIRRFIFMNLKLPVLQKDTINDYYSSWYASQWTSTVAGVLHMNKIVMGTYENFWPTAKAKPKRIL